MSSERYTLFLFLAGLFIVLAAFLVMLGFMIMLPSLVIESDLLRDLPETVYLANIKNELRCISAGGIQYAAADEHVAYPSSSVFVESGFISREPLNSFLFWMMQFEESLELCE